MAYVTSWLIGSVADLPAQTISIDGSPHVLAAGSYYLRDASAPLSMVAAVQALLLAAGVAAPAVYLTKSRHIRITAGANFAISWGTGTALRDYLGFSGNLSGASEYQATLVSPLLWSPAKPESSTMAPWNIRGHRVHTTIQSVSAYTGRTESVSHGSREYNAWFWRNVKTDRVWTASELGGEWIRWFSTVAVLSARFRLYSQISEEPTTSTTAVTYPYAGLGPYILSATKKGVNWSYERSKGLEWTDRRADIEINAHVCAEYGT